MIRGIRAIRKYYTRRGGGDSRRRWESRRNRRVDGARHRKMKEEMEIADFLYGKASVLAALWRKKRTVEKLMIQETMFDEYHDYVENRKNKVTKENRVMFSSLKRALDTNEDVRIVSKSKMLLNEITGNRPHQGLVMKASKLELEMISDIPHSNEKESKVWLALDEVVDPQNLGALLRSSAFLGIEGVLISSKNSAPLNATVSKASSGALETMDNVYGVKNLPAMLRRAAEEGGWRVLGASLSGPVVTNLRDIPTGIPTVLVLGNEGKGLRTNVLRACTGGLVRIEGGEESCDGSATHMLDSLNVSVAGGIALHHLINY